VTRFRAALPHQLDGPGPTKADLPDYVKRVDELEAENEYLRAQVATWERRFDAWQNWRVFESHEGPRDGE
jgi:hypothetical protein